MAINPRVTIIATFIGEDLTRKIPIKELAGYVNLSPSRLRQMFRDEIGLTPQQYLNILRLKKAKELLETSFLSIKEIRLIVGAKEKSRFARDFNKVYGLTPHQYREKHLQERFSDVGNLFDG